MCPGNQTDPTDDRQLVGVTFDPADGACPPVRRLISAAADGVTVHEEDRVVEAHLAGCAECAAYRSRVIDLARSTRVRPVGNDAEFVARVMERAQPARLGRGAWLRPALAWCGLVVAGQSLRPLLWGDIDGAATHVARHVGASTLALAVGLLYVAWRPHRAYGLLPFVAALFVTMTVSALLDVASGDRAIVSEVVHLSELVGLVLVWMIAGSPGWDRVTAPFRRGGGATASPTS